MSPKLSLVALLLTFVMLAASCGSGTVDVEIADEGDAQTQPADGDDYVPDDPIDQEDDLPEGPIPVEPDGGIGDGAEPLPGAEEPADEGTWHGQQVAVTNCPGMDWKRVQANEFSFSVPADFIESDVQPIDSEVGIWTGGNQIEVLFDYGWYSGSIAERPGAENEVIDYSGVVGEQTIIRSGSDNRVGVYFDEVGDVDESAFQTDRLSMIVSFADANDEIIGRCIVGSIEWGA